MSRSQGLERFLGCLNGWTCESALPLGPERDAWYVHRRVAVWVILPKSRVTYDVSLEKETPSVSSVTMRRFRSAREMMTDASKGLPEAS